jgi:hypothetical protein
MNNPIAFLMFRPRAWLLCLGLVLYGLAVLGVFRPSAPDGICYEEEVSAVELLR